MKTIGHGLLLLTLEFDRCADLLWSPSGRHLAITDRGGSGFAEVWIIDPRDPQSIMNVADVLPEPIAQIARTLPLKLAVDGEVLRIARITLK